MKREIGIPKGDATVSLKFNALVFVGANGSGKSRLGIEIEDSSPDSHRVSAQRALVFKEEIEVKSKTAAEMFYRFGNFSQQAHWDEDRNRKHTIQQKRSSRWGSRPESHLLNDFDHVLSMLIAHEHALSSQFKKDYQGGSRPEKYPMSKLDRVLHVWKSVMPHREIEVSDNKVYATGSGNNKFHGLGMSDGERVAFYLIAQAICAPDAGLLIVDEPEIHLHCSIQSRLWDAIEAERADCSFIYITHDLDFAASRSQADLIWVKGFDGEHWDWEHVDHVDGFPTELTLEILGSRKPVLFVEGTTDSIDTQIYQRIYSEFHIVPRESCLKVIESTRALRTTDGFHGAEAFGVIDRDFRAEPCIAALEIDGVFTTPVAEAENVICLPFIVAAAARHLNRDEHEVLEAVIEVSFGRLQHQLDNQIKERASQEIRHALGQFSSKGVSDRDSFVVGAEEFKSAIDASAHYETAASQYAEIIGSKDYLGLLRCFNNKGLEDAVAKTIGFANRSLLRNWVLCEIDASMKAEAPSEVGAHMLHELRHAFPCLPIASQQSGSVAAMNVEATHG
ncbi:AAA family ATPase [Rosistilla oblonga]|uniref:AAA family ATPase n=1 Tax=Rosistilla oblonga TaxID=2527990 RepID=UPI003A96A29D